MSFDFQHEHAVGMHDQKFLRSRVMRLQQSFVTVPRSDTLVAQVLAGVCSLSASPADAAPLLDFVIAELSLARANLRGEPHLTCWNCGSILAGGEVCPDATCPYSKWPQEVSASEQDTLSEDEIVARHMLVRAEVHSDDHCFEARFFANRWLASASDEDLVELAHQDWGSCEVADAVARASEHISLVAAVFGHCERQHGLQRAIGFECTLRAEDALAWVRQHRPALLEQLSAARAAGGRMLSAQTPPNAGRPAASLGDTALEVWRTWRGLGWQGLPCYGEALGMGDFTWMANGTLHKWLTPYTTRLATPSEQDDVWDCLLSGALRIYTRRNGLGVSFQPVRILHEMTGQPLPSGLGRPGATGHFGEKVGTSA